MKPTPTTIVQRLKLKAASQSEAGNNVLIHDTESKEVASIPKEAFLANVNKRIDGIVYPDGFTKTGLIKRVGNEITIESEVFAWKIELNPYTNLLQFKKTIEATTTIDLNRIDSLGVDTNNTILYFKGDEVDETSVAIAPVLPANILKLTDIYIIGNEIVEVTEPTLINNKISIQDVSGVEKFEIQNYIKFDGVSIDPSKKLISIDALVPLSAFLDTVDGDDITATLENSKKPFKTFKALQDALPVNAGETYTIYITGGTIPITRRIQVRNFNWVAYTPVVLDFTNCMLDDGITNTTNCLITTAYGGTATWFFNTGNISFISNYVGDKYFSSVNNGQGVSLLGNINIVNWKSTCSNQSYRGSFHLGKDSNLIINEVYDSSQNTSIISAFAGLKYLNIKKLYLQYMDSGKAIINTENASEVEIDLIQQIGTLVLDVKCYFTGWTDTILKLNTINFNTLSKIQPTAYSVIFKGSVNDKVNIDLFQCAKVSGILDSINYPTIGFASGSGDTGINYILFSEYTGKLKDIYHAGNNYKVIFNNSIIRTNSTILRSFNSFNDDKIIVEFNGFNVFLQQDTLKPLFEATGEFGPTIINILDNGTTKKNVESWGERVIYTNPTNFGLEGTVDTAFVTKPYSTTMSVVHNPEQPNFNVDLTGNLDLTITGTSNGVNGIINLYFSGTQIATLNGFEDLVVTGNGKMIPVYFIHDTDGVKWYYGDKQGDNVDTSEFAEKQGTVLYHKAIATNTGTISNVGNVITGVGTELTDEMVGAKIVKSNGEVGYIDTITDSENFTTLDPFTTDEEDQAFAIYAIAVKIDNDGSIELFQKTGERRFTMEEGGAFKINGITLGTNGTAVIDGGIFTSGSFETGFGKVKVNSTIYADHAEAIADTDLDATALYKIIGNPGIFSKQV